MMNSVVLFLALLSVNGWSLDRSEVEEAVRRGQAEVVRLKSSGGYWHLPSYLGPHYISQYYLASHWLKTVKAPVDTKRLEKLLLDRQLPDGSWQTVRDLNHPIGSLEATVMNYWALKVMGLSTDSEPLRKARAFILLEGGVRRLPIPAKAFLALFGNYRWSSIPNIPYLLFRENFPLNYTLFAQWVSPTLMPLAYFRNHRPVRSLGEGFQVGELRVHGSEIESGGTPSHLESPDLVAQKILELQQPHGSWGGYGISTLFSIMALEDYEARFPMLDERARGAIERGAAFLEQLYLADDAPNAYLGRMMDGKYWDTSLLLNGLRESGAETQALESGMGVLAASQTKEGGFFFGDDFEVDPDCDDTAAAILALSPDARYRQTTDRAIRWLLSMQNDDGGWAAFDRNNIERPMLSVWLRPFETSVALYDQSSADVTGHVLEALGTAGFTIHNSEPVRRAIDYLRKQRDPDLGVWRARWGINYIYSLGAVVPGVVKVGVSPDADWIQSALHWLKTKQNADGGFGEAAASYADKTQAGVGISTPSQTAWALLAFMAGNQRHSTSSGRAVEYLVSQMKLKGKWEDATAVGTGHPKIVYMEYPAYPHAFPLVALGRYLRHLE